MGRLKCNHSNRSQKTMVNLLLSMLSWPKVILWSASHCKCVFLLFKKGIVRSLNYFFCFSTDIITFIWENFALWILSASKWSFCLSSSFWHRYLLSLLESFSWGKTGANGISIFSPLSSVVLTLIPNYTRSLHTHNIPP